MDSYLIRAELKRMGKSDLFKLTWQQRTGWCSVGACKCAFLIKYKDFTFCLTELMGQRCPSTLEDDDRAEEGSEGAREQTATFIPVTLTRILLGNRAISR